MGEEYKDKTVLLVDDSQTIRHIIANELRALGFLPDHIREARDGRVALVSLKKSRFDLIISDWDMAGMDGITLLRKVKEDDRLKNIPFLMITSKTDEEKQMEAFQSGADQYITKPFKPRDLEDTIHQLLIKPCVFEDKSVLIVEDSATMRTILVNISNQAGFAMDNIFQAANGEDALAAMSSAKIDLVLTDWHMPQMTGLDFMVQVKAQDCFKHIPFVMVTGEADRDKVTEAVQQGACGYIIKPFKPADLQKKIKEAL